MKRTVAVIYVNFRNLNNRIYNTEQCNRMIEQHKKKKKEIGVFYGCIDDGQTNTLELNTISMNSISHTIDKLYLHKGVLFADISILKTKSGDILRDNFDSFVFRTACTGVIVDVSGKVDIDKFIGINAIDKKSDSYYVATLREKKLKRILKEA